MAFRIDSKSSTAKIHKKNCAQFILNFIIRLIVDQKKPPSACALDGRREHYFAPSATFFDLPTVGCFSLITIT
ncbi:hypothetical protein, partial [Lacticaseibacillus paracasei]|uniref:hypothetical protein n=1 Tax=Lacticaseibacillus paracasei TaxID=1597 RepID=UPI0019D35D2B